MAIIGPEEIRRLRGELSRTEFARRLGVTPLTVYRWELPDGAAQARRPRGARARALAAMVEGEPHGASPPRSTDASLASSERSELVLILDRLAAGEARRAEDEALNLLASGRLRTTTAHALAGQTLARAALFARGACRDALATLLPILGDVDALPDAVALEVHVTAALIFSSPDGRVFNPGRCNAHVARAERLMNGQGQPETRCLLAVSRLAMAYVLGEPLNDEDVWLPLRHMAATGGDLVRSLAAEAEAIRAFVSGHGRRGWDGFEALSTCPIPTCQVRALSHLAYLAVEEMRPPDEILAFVERARGVMNEHRLVPGFHSMILAFVEGELLSRLGRFDDAEQAFRGGLELVDEIGWNPGALAVSIGRMYLHVRPAALEPLGRRFLDYSGSIGQRGTRALGGMLVAAAALATGGDPAPHLATIESEMARFAGERGWTFMARDVAIAVAAITIMRGPVDAGRRALARAERYLERFPSSWGTAFCRRFNGVLLAREGRLHEARQALEAALGTFTLGGDRTQSALTRRALANVEGALRSRTAEERLARSEAELRELGLVSPPTFHPDSVRPTDEVPAPHSAPPTDIDRLVVPIQRLSIPGMSASLIQRELVAIVKEWVPDATVRLDELGADDPAAPIERLGPDRPTPVDVELSAGRGKRLRLAVGGPGAGVELHPLLTALAGVASLSLELAELRALTEHPPHPPVADGGETPELPGFVAVSPEMRRLRIDVARLSQSRATVIVTGESGTGKEVVARAIHDLSLRSAEPFVAVNCSAVPHHLFEGMLFGHKRGAFTGASGDQLGVIRAAAGGTLFLDEVGELPIDVQPKLLRFLEQGEILPIGERKPMRVDIRVIAATNRDLEQLVREGRFREDLYYRLQVVPVRIPPLRARSEDVIALARHFVQLLTPADAEPPVLAPDALAALTSHTWPGNVRELRNVVERSLAFAPLPAVLGAEHLRIHG